MPSLFADTHNVVAILEKSDASEGFAQIIDFLSGSYINYALTVSPHIYISCIKQFWNTVVVKRTDDVTRTSPSQAAEGTSILVQQVLDKYSALVHRVEGLKSANTAQQLEILKLKARVKKLERLNKVKSSKLKRLKKVGTSQCIESSEDEENVFNQGRKSVDIDEGIEIVDDQQKDVQVKERQADTQENIYNIDLDHTSKVILAAEPVVAAVSTPISAAKPKGLKAVPAALTVSTRKRNGVVIRDPEEELHDDTPTETQSAKDKGKGIFVEDPKPMKRKDQIAMDAERYHGYKKKPQSESQARKNMIDYLKNIEEKMEKEEQEIIKSINETPAQKAAKRRRLCEQAKEAEDLKKQLENFDREDLEDLWKIVKTRFFTSKPTNWTDDYLLATLKNMFEKTGAQDVLWKSQQAEHGQALVKS
nr:hypothetical protein [Tanacetum cinerariifolium]